MLEPQKAHATSEFIIVVYNGVHALLCSISSFAAVVRQFARLAGNQNLSAGIFFKKTSNIWLSENIFLLLTLYLMLDIIDKISKG